jgi:hypothetical protein
LKDLPKLLVALANDLNAACENLTAVQTRCTEQQLEIRKLKDLLREYLATEVGSVEYLEGLDDRVREALK